MVSVIIVNYNTFQLTCACIKSVLEKTKGCSIEIIVVDNCSTDVDPQQFSVLFPQIKLIINKENTGFARGNNTGIQAASGDQILLLNSDTELLNDAITITRNYLKHNSIVGIAGCCLQFPDGRIQHNCQPFPDGIKIIAEKIRLHKILPAAMRSAFLQGHYFDYTKIGQPDWIWGTYFHFRRDILDAFPGKKLNDEYFMYVEDMLWCYEAKKAGWRVGYEPAAKVLHHHGGSGGERPAAIRRNYLDFIRRYYSPVQRWLLEISGYTKQV
jgi:GT2 family glycosyltransferase